MKFNATAPVLTKHEILFFPVDSKNTSKIRKINEDYWKFSKIFLLTGIITLIAYTLKPLLNCVMFKCIFKRECILEFLTQSQFFYDATKSPVFELTYFIAFCNMWLITLLAVSIKKRSVLPRRHT